jgi:basic membrane protein A
MNHISSRAPRRIAALLAIAVAAGACSTGSDGSSTPRDDAHPRSSIVVIVAGEPTDPFTVSALSGARNTARSLHAELTIIQTTSDRVDADVEVALTTQPTLIIGVGARTVDAIDPAAAANLDQEFIVIGGEAPEPTANLTAAVFRRHEGLYLTGVEAGLMSRSGTVGAVAPPSDPLVDAWVGTFETGVRAAGVKVVTARADDAGTDRALSRLDGRGADVVQTVMPETPPVESTPARPSFGVGPEGCGAPAAVDSVVTHADLALDATVREVVGGRPGGVHSFGLAEGGITLAALDGADCLIARDARALSRIRAARDAIADGSIDVPDPDFAR